MIPILLARHAETTANVDRWISGWRNDVDLTARGEALARDLGRRIREQVEGGSIPALAGILSSDLHRARRTTAIANDALGLTVAHHPGLRERNYGDWTGRPYEDLGADPKAWKAAAAEDPNANLWRLEDWAPPGGETLEELRNRIVEAVEDGVRSFDRRPFLIISHRGAIRALLQVLHGAAYEDTPSLPNPPEWMRVDWDS